MFRLLLTAAVAYLGYRYIKGLWSRASSDQGRPDVHGQTRENPLDIDKNNIVDAEFEDIDEEGDST